ncbi:YueH family protein [Rossellomorea aquimaris]|uniref:YueH family protein n=1 Tax=Rossellomorea aquimaris TaxID=189382 RepID=UPI001CD1BDA6|nr:YueH family protein [Rossellomorea aquimaris]MCA1056677.1 YueH family protein [Rossellomorea aquimaris]
MKIRKNFLEGLEQKVYIYENKREELILIAIPDLEWSFSITYEEEDPKGQLMQSLKKLIGEESADVVSERILQWTREM